MQISLDDIPVRECLHYLGWRGTPVEQELIDQIHALIDEAKRNLQPHAVMRRFPFALDGKLEGTLFFPQGNDLQTMLSSCHEVVVLAATLGAQSERMLLRAKAQDVHKALLLDAVLSAAIEEICNRMESDLRASLEKEALFLTDRFSPGYGDTPITQTKEICEALEVGKTIGLTVSGSGIMIPRKSVTAVMGVSRTPVGRRCRGCEVCSMRSRCAFAMAL